MSKRLLNDIVVRSRLGKKEIPEKLLSGRESQNGQKPQGVKTGHTKGKTRNLLWFVALVSIIFCFFAISLLFSSAEVVVNPKNEEITLNENLSASKDSNSSGLFFNLVIIPGEESKTIQATGEKNVALNATGTVIIFNSYSTSSQTLSADTRLEGSNGKIYKTQAKSIIPGVNSGGISGQAEVKIYAAEAGETYNSETPLDFTILGFKGTPKYSKFKVRSKPGTTISGGFSGSVPDVSDSDRASIIADLRTALQTKLLKQAAEQVPGDFILFNDATFFDSSDTDISSVPSGNDSTLTLKGTLYGFIFNVQQLTKKIAEDSITGYDGSDVFISNIHDLVFSLENRENVSFGDVQNINFNLSGQANFFWKVDVNKFIVDLLGRSRKDFYQVLSQYKNIDSATLKLNPMWRMSIPDKIKDIKVIVNYPK